MNPFYPLRFHPILRRYLWGGRRLASLGKPLGPESDYAESWEIVDRGDDSSRVAYGSLAGTTLGQLTRQRCGELCGRHAPQPRFPLLFKFLDAHDRLSIQVHPDDARAARLVPPDAGKTEAWVILAAEQGSHLWAGLRRGIDRTMLRHEVLRRTVDLCMQRIEPREGDCFFLPAGVVHALGGGLLVAEIQQPSDTTYRLYDWNRLGPDGQPRELHLDQALEASDYDHGPVAAQEPQPTGTPGVERLVCCDKFFLDRQRFSGQRTIGGDDRFHLLAVTGGALTVAGDPAGTALDRGGVTLLPACLGPVEVTAEAEVSLLDIYLP